MRLTVNADPDDFQLAVRAAKSAIEREQEDAIITYEDGSKFWVRRAPGKKRWVVTAFPATNKPPPNDPAT